jgi:protein gp37
MAKETKIQWCDSTFNPWWGCTKISPGCENCYAADIAQRFKRCEWGDNKQRVRTSPNSWNEPRKWNKKAEKTGVRTRVFAGSMCDWLDPTIPAHWLADFLILIAETPHLNWLLLTKRIELWKSRIEEARTQLQTTRPSDASGTPHDVAEGMCNAWLNGTPPSNIWLGTTVENQKQANKRIPELLKIPAKIRFLSCEPLLGEINIRTAFPADHHIADVKHGGQNPADIDWVICGGETGAKARLMHPAWARSLRDQCAAANGPFFFKSNGEWDECLCPNDIDEFVYRSQSPYKTTKVGNAYFAKVGKKLSGNLLDGVEHQNFPTTDTQ